LDRDIDTRILLPPVMPSGPDWHPAWISGEEGEGFGAPALGILPVMSVVGDGDEIT